VLGHVVCAAILICWQRSLIGCDGRRRDEQRKRWRRRWESRRVSYLLFVVCYLLLGGCGFKSHTIVSRFWFLVHSFLVGKWLRDRTSRHDDLVMISATN
jgi:hypothetical protein